MKHTPHTSAVLLAGGIGARMGNRTPKQFMLLKGKPVALYSFNVLLSSNDIDEIIVVCAKEYQYLFQNQSSRKPVRFALPGATRQDSAHNGFLAASPASTFICVHDSARPFIDGAMIKKTLAAAAEHGAAAPALPMKNTIKEVTTDGFVARTPDRSLLWEVQTPQIVARSLLEEGFDYANARGITVTDDVSLVELIGGRIKIVEGSPINLKITVPSDIAIADHFMESMET